MKEKFKLSMKLRILKKNDSESENNEDENNTTKHDSLIDY